MRRFNQEGQAGRERQDTRGETRILKRGGNRRQRKERRGKHNIRRFKEKGEQVMDAGVIMRKRRPGNECNRKAAMERQTEQVARQEANEDFEEKTGASKLREERKGEENAGCSLHVSEGYY
jgi:hypothetical protein